MIAVEDRVAFPVASGGDAIGFLEQRRVDFEQGVDLVFTPDIELAFHALRVCIECRGEAAPIGNHLAQQPANRFADAQFGEQALVVAPDMKQQVEQLRVVVEHLFEMRHEPCLVGGIAREATADMVVDAALAHAQQ